MGVGRHQLHHVDGAAGALPRRTRAGAKESGGGVGL